ncbi:hypothetical protein REPUB_Repub17cG0075400 [Reevesia pubescens]
MVLFRREFSFVDTLYLWEVFVSYVSLLGVPDSLYAYAKTEIGFRKNVRNGKIEKNRALAIFLVASVLETKNKQILKEAKCLDDVVMILGNIIGNLDAKKACNNLLKIQNKYLTKAKKP